MPRVNFLISAGFWEHSYYSVYGPWFSSIQNTEFTNTNQSAGINASA